MVLACMFVCGIPPMLVSQCVHMNQACVHMTTMQVPLDRDSNATAPTLLAVIDNWLTTVIDNWLTTVIDNWLTTVINNWLTSVIGTLTPYLYFTSINSYFKRSFINALYLIILSCNYLLLFLINRMDIMLLFRYMQWIFVLFLYHLVINDFFTCIIISFSFVNRLLTWRAK